MVQLPRPPRFRIVIDVTLEHADPWDASEYHQVLAHFKRGIETMSACACRDVVVRESRTIGDAEDYSDWRYHRGAYAPSQDTPSISFQPHTVAVPAVDAADLKALWALMRPTRCDRAAQALGAQRRITMTEIREACGAGADITAVSARMLTLQEALGAGLLADWCRGDDPDECVFRTAAKFPLKRIGDFSADAFVDAVRRDSDAPQEP